MVSHLSSESGCLLSRSLVPPFPYRFFVAVSQTEGNRYVDLGFDSIPLREGCVCKGERYPAVRKKKGRFSQLRVLLSWGVFFSLPVVALGGRRM